MSIYFYHICYTVRALNKIDFGYKSPDQKYSLPSDNVHSNRSSVLSSSDQLLLVFNHQTKRLENLDRHFDDVENYALSKSYRSSVGESFKTLRR